MLAELAEYLDTASLGAYDPNGVTGDIFISTMPATPDNAIALFPSGGPKADSKHGYDLPTVQIRVRGGRDPRPAYAKMQGIYNLLHGLDNVDMGGVHVINCYGIQSGPQYMGADSNQRHEFVINFQFENRNEAGNRE